MDQSSGRKWVNQKYLSKSGYLNKMAVIFLEVKDQFSTTPVTIYPHSSFLRCFSRSGITHFDLAEMPIIYLKVCSLFKNFGGERVKEVRLGPSLKINRHSEICYLHTCSKLSTGSEKIILQVSGGAGARNPCRSSWCLYTCQINYVLAYSCPKRNVFCHLKISFDEFPLNNCSSQFWKLTVHLYLGAFEVNFQLSFVMCVMKRPKNYKEITT